MWLFKFKLTKNIKMYSVALVTFQVLSSHSVEWLPCQTMNIEKGHSHLLRNFHCTALVKKIPPVLGRNFGHLMIKISIPESNKAFFLFPIRTQKLYSPVLKKTSLPTADFMQHRDECVCQSQLKMIPFSF